MFFYKNTFHKYSKKGVKKILRDNCDFTSEGRLVKCIRINNINIRCGIK